MKKNHLIIIVVCISLLLVTGCSTGDTDSQSGTSGDTTYLSIGTGSVSGVYYPLGGALASIINNNMEGYNCSVESTGGAVENCLLIAHGKIELGFSATSSIFEAQNKIGAFENEEISNLRGVVSLYPEVVQIVSTDSSIKSVEDLKGKRVAVGSAGSGTETIAKSILLLYGMTYDDIKVDYLGFGDAASGLKDNTIDAAFVWAGVPTSGLLDLGSQKDISMINFSDEKIEDLKTISPYVTAFEITQDYYSSLIENVQTIAIPAAIACDESLSEELVYDFLTALFENLDVMSSTHERGKDITLDSALEGMEGIELHPGAEKFYKEKGVL